MPRAACRVPRQGEPVRYVRDHRRGVPDVPDTVGIGGVYSEDCSRGRGALQLLRGGKTRRTGEIILVATTASHVVAARPWENWCGPGG